MTLLVRVDGSDQLGMGHVMRCLSLVRELAKATAVEPVFVMRAFALGTRWVAKQGHEVVPLPADLAPREEAEWFSALIQERQAHGVITDLRTLPPGLLDAVHATGALCVVIDEWGRRAIRGVSYRLGQAEARRASRGLRTRLPHRTKAYGLVASPRPPCGWPTGAPRAESKDVQLQTSPGSPASAAAGRP